MTHMKTTLTGLFLLIVVSPAYAEYRTVLVLLKQDKDKKVSVTIHSDVKTEQKSAASVEDAIKVIGEMKGWGSSVGIYITADRGLARDVRNKLFAAIDDNAWLNLEHFGREVPKVVRNHFLRSTQDK